MSEVRSEFYEHNPTEYDESKLELLSSFFSQVESLDENQIISHIESLPVEGAHKEALVRSVEGDRSEVDKIIRSNQDFKIWMVNVPPELNSNQKYAWMYGVSDTVGEAVKRNAEDLHSTIFDNPLLTPPPGFTIEATPPIVWINPIKSSNMPRPKDDEGMDEFYIFQIPKSNEEAEIDDFHQELVLNGEVIDRNARVGLNRLKALFDMDKEVLSELEDNIEYYSRLHLEGHNQGHFVGPWPLDQTKKDHPVYDFIEELRACLCAVEMQRSTNGRPEAAEALAVQLLTSRMLVHGLNAYNLEEKTRTRQEVREIVVPTILFEHLLKDNAIVIDNSKMQLNTKVMVQSMYSLLKEIHDVERIAYVNSDSNLLHEFTVNKLKESFPEGNYSENMNMVLKKANSVLT